MSDNENEKIEPVEFDISKSPLFAAESAPQATSKPSFLVWFGLSALVIVALAVIFVLPTVVTEYELPLERRVELASTTAPNQVSNATQVNAISPFEEAQKSLQRKEAQDVLAELLRLQAELKAREVEDWAAEIYNEALGFAQMGDVSYLAQEFIDARNNYADGVTLLQDLQERIPAILSQHLIDGEAALAANDAQVSLQKFSTALKLDPTNSQAKIGHSRALVLDEVNTMLDNASEEMEAGNLEAARKLYLAALELDERDTRARQGVGDVNQQLVANEFSRVMSQGYAYLQDDQPGQAIQAFQQASRLGINQDQALAAIQQTQDEVARVDINRLRSEAATAEAGEQWQAAVEGFTGVLNIDENLSFALEGIDYAGKRLRLDQLLEYAINNPERLADDNVYQETLDIFYTGRAIENPGPRLSSQLDRLQVLIDASQIPQTISFISDNTTKVTLLRVAELGTFESHSVSLKPGRYVAVGVREGFRDVRQEFIVGFGQTPESVSVKCDESIAVAKGR